MIALSFLMLGSCAVKHEVLNKGIAGNSTNDLIKRIDQDVLAEKPDLVIMLVGTNDMLNSGKFISYGQFQANYAAMLNKLKAQNISVVVMSPPPVDTAYLFKRHQRALFTEDPNHKIDSVSSIIRQLAQVNQIYFMDLNKLFKAAGSPNPSAQSLLINQANFNKADGVHPTAAGYRFMAQHLYDFLQANHLLKKNKKILCFGDSITFGAFMDGQGTAGGETYPAFLQALLGDGRK
ncbi:hypothetical protein AAE02nite_37280 [Adhaeribacter aerolatus]|uniref:SGNH hydrolase-type esterase domain-containing protein n=2 Tax=Adhaeribacter aerolatus TaxID=670289 RepID=A0A512B272_9BACT|nr:hypothetical protein AAE02nite_37280 [Adhaeribacter aerolatus]